MFPIFFILLRYSWAQCPCANPRWCRPVPLEQVRRPQVFAFSPGDIPGIWRHFDWARVTTIAWNLDKELLCHAHAHHVQVVIRHDFNDVDNLCNPTARRTWIEATYTRIVANYADGVNIDTEAAMHGPSASCQTVLVKELRHYLSQREFTQHAQITFDVPWAPHGVDGRYYDWTSLSQSVDYFFVMAVRA